MFREGGAEYEDAEGMAVARSAWRIRDGIPDGNQTDDALRLLQSIIALGMLLLSSRRNRNAGQPAVGRAV